MEQFSRIFSIFSDFFQVKLLVALMSGTSGGFLSLKKPGGRSGGRSGLSVALGLAAWAWARLRLCQGVSMDLMQWWFFVMGCTVMLSVHKGTLIFR